MTETPVLLAGQGQLRACTGDANTDGTSDHNVLVYISGPKGGITPGNQQRPKFATPSSTIPAGDSVPSGSTLRIETLHVYVSLGYTIPGSSPNCAIGETLDALEIARWKVMTDGATHSPYENMLPSSSPKTSEYL